MLHYTAMPPGRMISTPKLWQHLGGTFNSVLGSLQMAPSCKHTTAEKSNCTPSNEASGPRVQAIVLSYMGKCGSHMRFTAQPQALYHLLAGTLFRLQGSKAAFGLILGLLTC